MNGSICASGMIRESMKIVMPHLKSDLGALKSPGGFFWLRGVRAHVHGCGVLAMGETDVQYAIPEVSEKNIFWILLGGINQYLRSSNC